MDRIYRALIAHRHLAYSYSDLDSSVFHVVGACVDLLPVNVWLLVESGYQRFGSRLVGGKGKAVVSFVIVLVVGVQACSCFGGNQAGDAIEQHCEGC